MIMKEAKDKGDAPAKKRPELTHLVPEDSTEIRIALDSCCIAQGAQQVFDAMLDVIHEDKLKVKLKSAACVGLSCKSPVVTIVQEEKTMSLMAMFKLMKPKRLFYIDIVDLILLRNGALGLSRSLDLLSK